MTARLPPAKLSDLLALTKLWTDKKTCTRKELESLIGKLSHACYVVPAGRTFLRRLINLTLGLRWYGGQTTRLSPLRFQVQSPVRWTRTQSSCEKSKVNALPKVVGFLRVLRFPPTGKDDRVG